MSSEPRPTKADVVSDFRRAQILEAARAMFIDRGIADTTVEGIAKAAGVAKGTVYLYYRSKDEILQQLVGADLAELQRATVPAIEGDGTIDEQLRRFFTAALEFYERNRDFIDHCQLDMSAGVRRNAREAIAVVFSAQQAAWGAALTRAAEQGEVTTDDATGIAQTIVGLAHGLALHRMRGWHRGDIETAVIWATRLVWQGLAKR